MISIRSSADMARALAGPLDPQLRELLEQRREQLTADTDLDLSDLMHLIVVGPSDTLDRVEGAAGVAIATNLVDGSRLGEPGFTSLFEYVERHGRWLEAVMILSDDGYGLVIFAADCITTDASILALLRSHA